MHASIFHANLVTAALVALVPLTAPVASAQAPDTAAEKTAELAAAAEAGDPWAMYFLAEAHRVRLRGGWPEVSFEGLLLPAEARVAYGLYRAASVDPAFRGSRLKADRLASAAAEAGAAPPAVAARFYETRQHLISTDPAVREAALAAATAAAEAGLAEPMYALYRWKCGKPETSAEAKQWLTRAAKAGHWQAAYVLGRYLSDDVMAYELHGIDLFENDFPAAARVLREATRNGYPPAATAYAALLMNHHEGVGHDHDTAVELFNAAAELREPEAMRWLAMIYAYGHHEIKPDPEAALAWMQKSIARNHPPAMRQMGEWHRDGDVVDEDLTKAVEWYDKAARHGDRRAKLLLGLAYHFGRGVEQDPAKAAYWYKAVVRGPDRDEVTRLARKNYANMLYVGEGVEQDRREALKWYRAAARGGDGYAARRAGHTLFFGEGVREDKAAAVPLFRQAAEAGDPDAMRLLGYAYWTGGGVDHDFAAGKRWIEQAAAAGDERAAALLESQSRYRRAPRTP